MSKRFNSVWPPPVYVALFADGSTIRMSFSTRSGKPIDFDRGRNHCCAMRGRDQEAARSAPDDPGYFESIEYRRVLRHYAQKLVDAVVSELCGTPMPITVKRYKTYTNHGELIRDKKGNIVWGIARCGYSSVPLFRSRLPGPTPATDIVDGWVEKGDETLPDQFFAPKCSAEVIELPQKRKAQSNIEKALALLAKLTPDERTILAERIAA